eukprot:1502175-Rhodomonas_salina.1
MAIPGDTTTAARPAVRGTEVSSTLQVPPGRSCMPVQSCAYAGTEAGVLRCCPGTAPWVWSYAAKSNARYRKLGLTCTTRAKQ